MTNTRTVQGCSGRWKKQAHAVHFVEEIMNTLLPRLRFVLALLGVDVVPQVPRAVLLAAGLELGAAGDAPCFAHAGVVRGGQVNEALPDVGRALRHLGPRDGR